MFNLGAADSATGFNTDYYGAPLGLQWNAAVSGAAPQQAPVHPALPALWWLGFVIALVIIRVASDMAQ